MDAADNLTTLRGQASAGINADNQSADLTPNYDGNGNPLDYAQTGDQAGSRSGLLGYDVLNRLSDAKYNANTTNHLLATYRSDGLRASKTVNVGGTPGAPIYFLYDGTRVVYQWGGAVTDLAYGYGAAGLAQSSTSPAAGAYTAYGYDPMGNVTCRVPQIDNTNAGQTQPAYDFSVYDAFGKLAVYLQARANTMVSQILYGQQPACPAKQAGYRRPVAELLPAPMGGEFLFAKQEVCAREQGVEEAA